MAYGVTRCGIPYRGELDLDKEEREYILYIEIYLLFWKKYGRRIGKGIEIFVKYFSYFSNYENFKQFDHLGYNLARINRKWLADG